MTQEERTVFVSAISGNTALTGGVCGQENTPLYNLGSPRGTATINAGALIRGKVRGFLDGLKFQGYDIEYVESKEFLGSTFYLRGDMRVIRGIRVDGL